MADTSPLTKEDEARVVELLTRDLRSTLGAGYEALARSTAARLRESGAAEYYVQRVVDDVQQQVHDEYIDTDWPACPLHDRHPLWFRGGGWWCETDGSFIASLGALPTSKGHRRSLRLWNVGASRPAIDGGPQLATGDRSIDPAFDQFWMVEGHGVPWTDTLFWLDPLFGSGFSELFVHFQSWWPGQRKKARAFDENLPGRYQEMSGTIAGAPRLPIRLKTILDARDACGGDVSGLWLIMLPRPGCSLDLQALAKWGGCPLELAVKTREDLLVSLSLDEGGLGTLLVHREHPERERLWDLRAWLLERVR